MPWKEVSAMSERKEFIERIQQEEVSFSVVCREFGVSRPTGYKWLRRYAENGEAGIVEHSRRPHRSPKRTSPEMERAILSVRSTHPSWGGVKILAYLERLGQKHLPSASTATAILQRNGKLDPQESCKHRPMQRFERAASNELWQMDFKGHFKLDQGRCHPLTILDDHSRYLVGLHACPNQLWETVQSQLTTTFRSYGLPDCMLMDNGSPWGDDWDSPYTILTSWIMRLGVAVTHGRPFHPQTQGKDERLHRTLQAEVLQGAQFHTLQQCQNQFDVWREFYNHERPHQALHHSVPAEAYHPSPRPFPETLPPILYEPADVVRMVDESGKISYRNKPYRISKAFRFSPVALRPTETDGILDVYYCSFRVAQIHLRDQQS